MQAFTTTERRRRLQTRHALCGDSRARSVPEVAERMLVLHASDPASVYLSALARCPSATLDSVATALYDDRSLVRLMGMRRTLFVAPQATTPIIHHGAALDIAERMRRGILKDLRDLPTEPTIEGDVEVWLNDVEASTIRALSARQSATAAQLSSDEPRLRTATLPVTDKRWDVRRTMTSRILTLLGADGHIVRGRPRGAWTSRTHSWEPASRWWPDGIPEMSAFDAHTALAEQWLRAFGPATVEDLQWWTGWNLTVTRNALAALDTLPVRLDAGEGVVLADDCEPTEEPTPAADLLPGLDPTPMGWKHRDWYLGAHHRAALFDRNGNIGPTLWWDGRIVGGWAVHPSGDIRYRILDEVGNEATTAIEAACEDLRLRLGGDVVVPSFRTPLERELADEIVTRR